MPYEDRDEGLKVLASHLVNRTPRAVWMEMFRMGAMNAEYQSILEIVSKVHSRDDLKSYWLHFVTRGVVDFTLQKFRHAFEAFRMLKLYERKTGAE